MRIPTGSDQSSRSGQPFPLQPGGKGGGRAGERGAIRRLVRLVIALVLVIVVMDTAGNPDIYRPFFGDQQPTVAPQPTSLLEAQQEPEAPPMPDETSTSETSEEASTKGRESLFPDTALIDFARQLMPLLSEQQRTTLTHLLAWQRQRSEAALERLNPDAEGSEGVIDSVEQAAESLQSGVSDDEALSGVSQRYGPLLRTVLAAARAASDDEAEKAGGRSKDPALQLTPQQVVSLKALQYALDESYQQKVVDGAVWSADDADAFYRYLERAATPPFLPTPSDAEAPSPFRPVRVGVVPLMQQPAIYQGRMVEINGTVARASRVEAKENPFGVKHYWEVWIRPADGTERPVVLYAPDVPEQIAAVGPQAALNRGPEILAVGVFVKRRLFHSVGGVEQAPVIVGRAVGRPSPPVEKPLAASTSKNPPLWLLVVIAAVVGVVLAGWVTWQSANSAKRSRQLRRKAERRPGLLPGEDGRIANEAASAEKTREDRS